MVAAPRSGAALRRSVGRPGRRGPSRRGSDQDQDTSSCTRSVRVLLARSAERFCRFSKPVLARSRAQFLRARRPGAARRRVAREDQELGQGSDPESDRQALAMPPKKVRSVSSRVFPERPRTRRLVRLTERTHYRNVAQRTLPAALRILARLARARVTSLEPFHRVSARDPALATSTGGGLFARTSVAEKSFHPLERQQSVGRGVARSAR